MCNNHPENQDVINKSYNNEKSTGKNIKIISDSIPRGLRMYEFNHYVTSGKAHLKAFPGATAKRLHHYILPTLYEDNPDAVILHVGYNDLSPKNGQLDDIDVSKVTKEILDIGETCRMQGVSKVFISGLICNRNHQKQLLINDLNNLLKEGCEKNGFIFINNEGIRKEHLWRDGIHMQESGKVILARNFIQYLNDFLYGNRSGSPHR